MRVLFKLPKSGWFTNSFSVVVSVGFQALLLFALAVVPLVDSRFQQLVLDFAPDAEDAERPIETFHLKTPLANPVDAEGAGSLAASNIPAVNGSTTVSELPVELAYFSQTEETEGAIGLATFEDAMAPIPINRVSMPIARKMNISQLKVDDALKDDPFASIVFRFIQYDIGRLTGEAGDLARQEFNALGADAVPALVWGLNQSAHLNQSCPVIVIQSKLNEVLSVAGDPLQTRYALNNVGQSVAPSAPYAHRLKAFRKDLARQLGEEVEGGTSGELSTADRLALQRIRTDRVRSLAKDADNLAEHLADSDPNTRWAAARIAAARGLPYVEELAVLLNDENADVRHQAHEALLRISRGEDYGPVNENIVEDRELAVRDWIAWWQSYRHEHAESIERHAVNDSSDDLASAALQLAERLEKSGRQSAADRRYREIVSRYPHTAAAKTAQSLLGN